MQHIHKCARLRYGFRHLPGTQIDFLILTEKGGDVLLEMLKYWQRLAVEATLLILVLLHSIGYLKFALGM